MWNRDWPVTAIFWFFSMALQRRHFNFGFDAIPQKSRNLCPNLCINCVLEKVLMLVIENTVESPLKYGKLDFGYLSIISVISRIYHLSKDKFLKCCLLQFWIFSSVLFQYAKLHYGFVWWLLFNLNFSFLFPPPLRTVIWDKNNITAQGFQDIAVALEK